MKRLLLLPLLPLGFAAGFATGAFLESNSEAKSVAPEPSPSRNSAMKPGDEKLARYRREFLQLLDEPSAALRRASYYAFARKVPTGHLPYAVDAIYPEGWKSYRGDLPLALCMEWARRDTAGFSIGVTQLFKTHPDLRDNLDTLFYNLGMLNAPGVQTAIKAIADENAQDFFAKEYIDGIRASHTDLLFQTRLSLLGPKIAFSKLSSEEFPRALATYWQDPEFYHRHGAEPSSELLLELGKQYGQQSLERIPLLYEYPFLIAGILISTTDIPTRLESAVAEHWYTPYSLPDHLSDQETRSLITALLTFESGQKAFFNGSAHRLWEKGLDRDLAEAILALPDQVSYDRIRLLQKVRPLFSPAEYLSLIETDEDNVREAGLLSLFQSLPSTQVLPYLQSLPEDWISEQLLTNTVQRLVTTGNADHLHKLAKQLGTLGEHLPNGNDSAEKLWDLAPQLYLESLENLDPEEKVKHLRKLVCVASADEVPLILESADFDQQTEVLIGLLRTKPELGTEILKHEAPASIDEEQAMRLGASLSLMEREDIAYDYFLNRDTKSSSDQMAVFTYCLVSKKMKTENHSRITDLSPQHDYINRVAAALIDESTSTQQMEILKQENPSIFMSSLINAASVIRDDQFNKKASQLLSSNQLTYAEKLSLHRALYGEPRS